MGRPRKYDIEAGEPALSKRDCILIAGLEVFLELGYDAASMDAVAARANVSKATIYAHFDNKRALFEAVMGRRCAQALTDFGVPELYDDARQALTGLAQCLLQRMLMPDALALHRVVMSESPRVPEVGEAFYEAGPAIAQRMIGRIFADLNRQGLLRVPEADLPVVADLFQAMLRGDTHYRALLRLPPSGRRPDDIATIAVELILARYGV